VLRTDLPSHRRSSEPELVTALLRRDPLALAELCSRTLPVAYAVARRLLPGAEVEALLLTVYADLWEEPPTGVPLERWIRGRTGELGLAELRESGRPPAAPSARTLSPDLPEPSSTYLDTTERTLAALDPDDRLALLRAHDAGVPSAEQEGDDAGRALVRALLALADPSGGGAPTDEPGPDGSVADWVLGLVASERAGVLEAEVAADAELTAHAQALRRGRRRIEGLPPTPDLGPRLVAAVLTTGRAAEPAEDPVVIGVPPQDTGTQGAQHREAQNPSSGRVSVADLLGEDDDHATEDLTDAAAAFAGPDETTGEDTPATTTPDAEQPSALDEAPDETADVVDEDWTDPWAAEGRPTVATLIRPEPEDEPENEPDGGAPSADSAATVPAVIGGLPSEADPGTPPDPAADSPPADPAEDEGFGPLDEPQQEPDGGGRSGLMKLLQAVGILVLIAGGIGLGLLIGQVLTSALQS
jgi:hypothetical protein